MQISAKNQIKGKVTSVIHDIFGILKTNNCAFFLFK